MVHAESEASSCPTPHHRQNRLNRDDPCHCHDRKEWHKPYHRAIRYNRYNRNRPANLRHGQCLRRPAQSVASPLLAVVPKLTFETVSAVITVVSIILNKRIGAVVLSMAIIRIVRATNRPLDTKASP